MKRIINGVTYNIETAAVVAHYRWDDAAGQQSIEHKATLYQTRGGAFFLVDEWEDARKDPRTGEWVSKTKTEFEALTREEVDELVANTDGLEIVDNSVLEDPPEATAETSPEATIYARVPVALKRRLDEAARAEGQSINAYVTRCLERCMAR